MGNNQNIQARIPYSFKYPHHFQEKTIEQGNEAKLLGKNVSKTVKESSAQW